MNILIHIPWTLVPLEINWSKFAFAEISYHPKWIILCNYLYESNHKIVVEHLGTLHIVKGDGSNYKFDLKIDMDDAVKIGFEPYTNHMEPVKLMSEYIEDGCEIYTTTDIEYVLNQIYSHSDNFPKMRIYTGIKSLVKAYYNIHPDSERILSPHIKEKKIQSSKILSIINSNRNVGVCLMDYLSFNTLKKLNMIR